ncbi:MAG: DNA mismatch repair protein MutS [Lachnospiraceae bacterium]|nr:DNA mismatch repair protein MutS [Lachnospiraceae bacterium]
MMRHYLQVKSEYPGCVVFYRLGDFYEMFFDDAVEVSRVLELTLTGRDCGLAERAPMCGVPYHAVEGYLTRLVNKGYKVAICEQIEDPKLAKGMVKRAVARVVTPGTNFTSEALDEGCNNFLMSVAYVSGLFGISSVDISTGDFMTTFVETLPELISEIDRIRPSEIIANEAFSISGADIPGIREKYAIPVSILGPGSFDYELCRQKLCGQFRVNSPEGLGIDSEAAVTASGAALIYLEDTQKTALDNLTRIVPYSSGGFMLIDTAACRNLELLETMRDKEKRGSLLWVLDKTRTAMGARFLRNAILKPLLKKEDIERRQDAVAELMDNMIDREELREYLNAIYDLERLSARISYKTAGPRELTSFKSSLEMLPPIRMICGRQNSSALREIYENIDPLEDVYGLIASSISDDPPITIREGGIIKDGYSEEVDRLRLASRDGKKWLAELEAKERVNTGIKNLRIRYNKVFGYYLEVTNSFKDKVPDTWQRRQTLTNAERYITPELKELEDTILGAEDRLSTLEYDLFCDIRDRVNDEILRVQKTARAIAELDFYASLACVAAAGNYVRPRINNNGVIKITEGRHPVIEKISGDGSFIPNDTYLDNKKDRIAIITGPNMAGKSTYMRQTALIVLMAHIGSFVPAAAADISLVDRIFTRVGASDDLSSGQSTFMVEMNEVANILRNATSRSLLILDEIGRGTSTYDGLSIAWAVVEYISDPRIIGAKTLFATHYHELTELEGKLDNVKNYCIAVRENGDNIIFLRKIIPGGADKSYGIQVARLAGVPEPVLKRAKEITQLLSDSDITANAKDIEPRRKRSGVAHGANAGKAASGDGSQQIYLFDMNSGSGAEAAADPEKEMILKDLSQLDISSMTPLQALMKLDSLQKKAEKAIGKDR